jgi:CLIP-associating protein 1/2
LEPQPEGDEKPIKPLEVYEDPFTEPQQSPPKPVAPPRVLEDKPVNEDAANLQKPIGPASGDIVSEIPPESPDKTRQNQRLLDSGIAKIKAKSLEVHGFRKLQSLLRDGRTTFTDERFEALLVGLFQYLEDPLSETSPEKIQDVKAQILATIKLLLKTQRSNIQPYVSRGLESLLQTRAAYDSRAHIVSGLELLAEELVALGDGAEVAVVLAGRLSGATDATTEGRRSLSMGLRVLQELVDKRLEFVPSSSELGQLTDLAGRCLDSADSGVRMGAVQLCVALHARVGEGVFWDALKGVKDDPKSLITYYIVKRQREQGITPTVVA